MNDSLGLPAKTVLLSPVLDVGAASSLAAELQASRGMGLTLNASEVQRISASCLQVLLSARLTWAADGAAYRVVEPSIEFTEGLVLLGADDLNPVIATVEISS